MGQAKEKPKKDMTPEELAQWKKVQAKRKAAYSHIKGIQKQARNRLRKELAKPERRALEAAFAREHANDTDQELYAYVKSMRRQRGKSAKPINLIGYEYIIHRLGRWDQLAGRINAELAEEKELADKNKQERRSTTVP